MAKLNSKKITDLHFDNKNINKGSEFGSALLTKSIQETGLGRSVLVDKNNVLIAGNKTVETAMQLGFENIVEIETNGKELIVVKRTDLDINTPMGAKAKILDNTVNKHNYREDAEMVAAVVEIAEVVNLNDYGLSSFHKEEGEDVSFKAAANVIKITLASKDDLEFALKDINYLMKQKYPDAVVTAKGK
jgi:hypothetical protein